MTTTNYRGGSAGQGRNTQARKSVADVAPNSAILPTTLWSRIAETISNPDFVAVALFSAIGLLATVNLILRIPDIGVI